MNEFKFWCREQNEIYQVASWYHEGRVHCYVKGMINHFFVDTIEEKKDGILLPVIFGLKSVDGESLTVGDVFVVDEYKRMKIDTPEIKAINDDCWSDSINTMIYRENYNSYYEAYFLNGCNALYVYPEAKHLNDEYTWKHCLDVDGNIVNVFTHDVGSPDLFKIMGVEK